MKPDGSTVVLFKDDSKKEVFLVFRSDYPIWGTTGGGIEKGETPQQTAIREAFEETGFKVKITKHCGRYQFPGCKGKWFKVDQLPKNLLTRTKYEILDAANHQGKPFVKKGIAINLINDLSVALRHPLAFLKYVYHKLTLSP